VESRTGIAKVEDRGEFPVLTFVELPHPNTGTRNIPHVVKIDKIDNTILIDII